MVTPSTKKVPSGNPKKRRRSRVGDINRNSIIKAAATVFSRKGYDGARVDEIALKAGLPKANVLYYFKSKQNLYRVVMEEVLTLWLSAIDGVSPSSDPVAVITEYVTKKLELSRTYPEASRIFAMEIISGAPIIGDYLRNDLRAWVAEKGKIFSVWQAEGRMVDIDPPHIFFMIWAVTQTYADFQTQIEAVLDVDDYESEVYDKITLDVVDVLIRGFKLT